MRADAAELYQRWWPVALRHSSRWAASEADAEDIAAAAIVAFIEEAPDGLSDRVIERALAKTISRSREDARRAGRGGFLPPAESEAVTDVDTATWERVRDALGSADLALIELASARTGGTAPHGTWAASASRRYRARQRAAAAAVSASGDETGAGPTCPRFVRLIPEVARRRATNDQRRSLLEHVRHCDYCDAILADRRTVAHRWKIAGGLGGLASLRRLGWRWWGGGAAHPVASATATFAAVGAVVAAAVVVPPLFTPAHARASLHAPFITTVTAPPVSSTTPPPPTTTTSATTTTVAVRPVAAATTLPPVTWGMRAQAVAEPPEGGMVPVEVLAAASRDGSPDAADTVTFASACGTAEVPTGPGGTAIVHFTCPTTAFPVTVSVADQAGATTSVTVVAT